MSDWLHAGATAGGFLSGLFESAMYGERNFQRERKNRDLMKQYQERTWQREDTAVQRRVADLKAAGLSPTLAAGSAAAASQAQRIEPGSFSERPASSGFDRAAAALNLMKMTADISKTNEEADLTNMQKAATQVGMNLTREQIREKEIKNWLEDHTKWMLLKTREWKMSKAEYDYQNAVLDRDIKAYKIDQAALDSMKAILEKELFNMGITIGTSTGKTHEITYGMLDLFAKRMAVDLQYHDRSYYIRKGYPSNIGFGAVDRGLEKIHALIMKGIGNIFK